MSPYTPNIRIEGSSQTFKNLTGAVCSVFFVLFELTAISQSTRFLSCRDIARVELSQMIKCLAQGHNTVILTRLEVLEKFRLILHLHPNFVYAISEDSDETKSRNLVH